MPTPGQPTLYKPEYCELAHNYCLLGLVARDGNFRSLQWHAKIHFVAR
jgi:hypothetical protein